MKDSKPQSKPEATTKTEKSPFKQKSPMQKAVFILQLVICIVSGGFIFPHVGD